MVHIHPMIVDTHCHLDYLKKQSLELTLSDCRDNNVDKIVTVAVSPDNQNAVLKIAEEHPMIFCSQGVHPHEASLWDDQCASLITSNLNHPKVIAVGEIGLDYHYEHSPRETQRKVFESQLDIAIAHRKPIIIHTREAEEDTLSILRNFESKINSNVVLHSYTSSMELAEYAFGCNYFLGFNGIITFRAAENVREVLRACPIELLVVETDAPYLAPVPHRGRENTPAYLPAIIEYMANEKGLLKQDLQTQLYKNSHNLFQI